MSKNEKKRFRPIDSEGRIFQERWELEYFFVEQSALLYVWFVMTKLWS